MEAAGCAGVAWQPQADSVLQDVQEPYQKSDTLGFSAYAVVLADSDPEHPRSLCIMRCNVPCVPYRNLWRHEAAAEVVMGPIESLGTLFGGCEGDEHVWPQAFP